MKTICALVVICLLGQGHEEIERLKPGRYYVDVGSEYYAFYQVSSSKDCFLVLPDDVHGVQVGIYDGLCDNRENGYVLWREENDKLQQTGQEPVLNSNYMNNMLSSARSQAASQARPAERVKKQTLQSVERQPRSYYRRKSSRMRSE